MMLIDLVIKGRTNRQHIITKNVPLKDNLEKKTIQVTNQCHLKI